MRFYGRFSARQIVLWVEVLGLLPAAKNSLDFLHPGGCGHKERPLLMPGSGRLFISDGLLFNSLVDSFQVYRQGHKLGHLAGSEVVVADDDER